MRIALYNFVQPGDPSSKQGGGVAIYQNNLVKALSDAGHDVLVMSSGDRYGVKPSKARLSIVRNGLDRAVVVDSPMIAPAHFSFYRIERYASDDGLDHIPGDLRARYGEVDVFHFQNVEGLTAGFFRALRRAYPNARLLLSAHNYNLVCPQVNLWHREHETCEDYRGGNACVNCLMGGDRQAAILNVRRLEGVLLKLGVGPSRIARGIEWLVRSPFRARRKLRAMLPGRRPNAAKDGPIVVTNADLASRYRRYRETNIALVSEVLDQVIAVSERTRQVLIDRGVSADKIAVSYIGTAHYPKFLESRKITEAGGHLHLAYLGYMRADKGFFFLLDALWSLDETLARDISVTIAAPLWDHHVVDRLRGMAHRFRAIRIFDGYSHATLDEVLAGVNLGVVPVLWEDNLPQVAIEMVARGIPILTSDRGGSQEIASNPNFVFKSGSRTAFEAKLRRLATGEVALGTFWRNEMRIFSMQDHIEDLMRFYAPGGEPDLRTSSQNERRA